MTEKQRGIIGGLSFTFLTFAVIALIHPSAQQPKQTSIANGVPAQSVVAPGTSQSSDGYDFERAGRDAAREAAFNCAALRDAVNEAREAGAKAQRYGWHESYSQAMDMERAETTLRECDQQ